jgi:hypothetical protein
MCQHMDEEEDYGYSELVSEFSLNKAAVMTILDAIDYRLRTWPGGNPDDQVALQMIQDSFRRAMLDHTFHEDEIEE